MIEIVKEGEGSVNKRQVPLNVRQVGEVKGKTKVYIEDYIITFMRQIATRDEGSKVLILYGNKQVDADITLFFVNGAILAECEEITGGKTVFEEAVWKTVNEKAGHYFKEAVVLGWIYIRYNLDDFLEAPIVNTHKEFFRTDQQIFMEYSATERLDHLYLFEHGNMEMQHGYFVYYERNEAMQNYMITVKQEESEEVKPEVDHAAKRVRDVIAEKQEEIRHRQTMGMLYGTSVAMLLLVTVIGITLFNNYEKMQNMERVLYDISAQMLEEEKQADEAVNRVAEVANQEKASVEKVVAEKNAMERTEGEEVKEYVSQNGIEASVELPEAEPEDSELPAVGVVAGAPVLQSEPVLVDPIAEQQEEMVIPSTYTIQKGDTLAKISLQFYGDESMIESICEANGIEDKNNIQYGVNIVLP